MFYYLYIINFILFLYLLNMNFFKKLFNTPFKKCIMTNQFYPMSLMIRIVNLFPASEKNTKTIFLPDSLYSIVI